MAKLKIFLKVDKQNREIETIELDPTRQYLVGRAADCDIVLPGERGVSRQHLRLAYIHGDLPYWQVVVLSQYGELYSFGEKVAEIQLNRSQDFSIPPIYFQYIHEQNPEMEKGLVLSSQVSVSNQSDDDLPGLERDDLTYVGTIEVAPYLKLFDSKGDTVQIFKLEGEAWMGGRDTSCQIFVDQESMSRRQFEIVRRQHLFFVRDLGSANGTLLNGQAMVAEELKPLKSGDILQVASWTFLFELHDVGYERRLIDASPYINSPVVYSSAQELPLEKTSHKLATYSNYTATNINHQTRTYIPPADDLVESGTYRPDGEKKNWLRLLTVGIVIVGGIFYFLEDDSSKKTVGHRLPAQEKASAFDKLKPEQQQFIRQSHKLSKDLLMQGRYEMARQEILKIHQFVPIYEDSAEIENTAVQGIQLQQERLSLDAKEKEKIEIEEKIQRQLQVCRAKMNANITAETIDDCLSSVIQFNPQHSGIQALRTQVDQIVTERNIRGAQQADFQRRVQKQKALYERAQAIQKRGQPLVAVKAYEEVIKSNLPDPKSYKGQAKREIASIQQKLSEEQVELEKLADASYKKGDLKAAIMSLKKAVEINPENEVTKGKVTSMLAELKKQMQSTYQEAILEESVGEVESAKVKWKKILERSLPDEDYYKKATTKLKKYGAL